MRISRSSVENYFDSHTAEIPCKSVKSKQRLNPVGQLYKRVQVKKNAAIAVFLRSFHRFKPKHAQSWSFASVYAKSAKIQTQKWPDWILQCVILCLFTRWYQTPTPIQSVFLFFFTEFFFG